MYPPEQFSPKYSSGSQLDDYFSISRHSISTDLQADDSLSAALKQQPNANPAQK